MVVVAVQHEMMRKGTKDHQALGGGGGLKFRKGSRESEAEPRTWMTYPARRRLANDKANNKQPPLYDSIFYDVHGSAMMQVGGAHEGV